MVSTLPTSFYICTYRLKSFCSISFPEAKNGGGDGGGGEGGGEGGGGEGGGEGGGGEGGGDGGGGDGGGGEGGGVGGGVGGPWSWIGRHHGLGFPTVLYANEVGDDGAPRLLGVQIVSGQTCMAPDLLYARPAQKERAP